MRRALLLLCSLMLAACSQQQPVIHHPRVVAGDPYTPMPTGQHLSGPQFAAAIDQRLNGTLEIDPLLGTGVTIWGLAFSGAAPTNGQAICNNNGVFGGCTGGSNIASYTGPVSITGNQTNGADQISNVNVYVINVQTYGASPSATAATNLAAIQAALDAAGGWNGSVCGALPHRAVFFPTGKYPISGPLHERCGSMNIFAADMLSGPTNSGFYGPTWLVEPFGVENLTYGPALIGTGLSMVTINTGQNSVLPLHEIANSLAGTLNGASGMSVEGWFEQTVAYGITNNHIAQANTAYPSLSGLNNGAFDLGVNSSGNLYGCANLTSGYKCIASTNSPSLNAAHVGAVDYDSAGSKCHLFLDGIETANSPITCTGTVVQQVIEVENIPSQGDSSWPFNHTNFTSISGFVGPIRIEKASKHTTNYTPAILTADSNTLALCNFVPSPDGTQAVTYGASGTAYLPIPAGQSGSQVAQVHMHDMFSGSWIDAQWSWQSEFDHIHFDSINAFFGMFDFASTDFEDSVHDNAFAGPSVIGIHYGTGFAEGISSNNVGGTAKVGYLIQDGSLSDSKSQIAASTTLINLWVAINSHVDLRFPFEDMESSDTAYTAGLYFAGGYAPSTVVNGELSTFGGAPYVIINGGAPVMFTGTQFGVFSADQDAAEVVDIINPPNGPIVLQNVEVDKVTATPKLANSPQYISTPGCSGLVTLSSGSGTLTKSCITTASLCSPIDTTTFGNAVTLAAPANGSIALSGGTGSDVIKVDCR